MTVKAIFEFYRCFITWDGKHVTVPPPLKNRHTNH
jgi:hypothetical protein